jgi:hypothetical protein
MVTVNLTRDLLALIEPGLVAELEALEARKKEIEELLKLTRPDLDKENLIKDERSFLYTGAPARRKKKVNGSRAPKHWENRGLKLAIPEILVKRSPLSVMEISREFLLSQGRRPTKKAIAKVNQSTASIANSLVKAGTLERTEKDKKFIYWHKSAKKEAVPHGNNF